MKKFKMKSIFAFLATAMLAMMLVGCGGEKKDAAADAGKGDKWVVAINSTFPPFESVKKAPRIIRVSILILLTTSPRR